MLLEEDAFDWRANVFTSPDQSFALETLTGPYAFPQWAGRRFAGVNLVPRPTDTGNGPNLPALPIPANFYDLVYDWGTQGPTAIAWTQWVKPQIDAMHTIGANCVRLIFQPTVRVGDVTHHGVETFRGVISNAQLSNVLDQLITYLASLGMWFYPAAMEAAAVDVLTSAQILQFAQEFTAIVSRATYHNIVGLDLVQECDRSTWAMATGNLTAVTATARAAMATPVPLTSSVALYTNWATAIPKVTSAGADFLDLHTYLYTEGLWLTLLSPNAWHLPIVTGETGIGYNGFYFDPTASAQEVTHPFSSELRARHYQDFVASVGQRYDQQFTEVWGTVKEWPADNQDWGLYADTQNGSFAFTTPRTEMVGPLQTVPQTEQAYDVTHTLDLTGPDTTIAAWSANSTFMLGWGQLDLGNRFSRSTNRVKRANSAIGVGLIDYYALPSVAQSRQVDFDASQATPSGGQIDWTVSLRHRGDTALNLHPGWYYWVDLASKPGDIVSDGQLGIWKAIDGVYTKLTSTIVVQPFEVTHSYRLLVSATGTYPTTLTATVTDLTLGTVYSSLTTTDSTPQLQGSGVPGFPTQIGDVYYTNVVTTCTNNEGPSVAAPTLGTVTATSLDVSWTIRGGVSPYRSLPQYVALDSSGFPSGAWTSLPATTGTTATITGITPWTVNYAVRVAVIDSSAVLGQAA